MVIMMVLIYTRWRDVGEGVIVDNRQQQRQRMIFTVDTYFKVREAIEDYDVFTTCVAIMRTHLTPQSVDKVELLMEMVGLDYDLTLKFRRVSGNVWMYSDCVQRREI